MTDASAQQNQPSLAIRAKPPSPRRLSRNVLLGGAITAAAIIAVALINGLSDQRGVQTRAPESIQAAGGPPQSIAGASSSYDAAALPFASESAELLPPEDPLWSGEPASADGEGASSSPAAREREPDPQDIARASAIMFAPTIANSRAPEANEGLLTSRLQPPRSRYVIQAGQVIPAALITGLNSDLPGQVVAQVTAPIYDTVGGRHLLIPQGARLIGVYNGDVSYGDRRLFLSWRRLTLPNGSSIDLGDMPATDPSGASGLTDRTNNHLGRLGLAIGLSAVISVIANEAEDNDETHASLTQSLGDAAAQQAAQSGARIVDRELTLRPSLTIRPGAPVRVIVTRDIQLRPYRP